MQSRTARSLTVSTFSNPNPPNPHLKQGEKGDFGFSMLRVSVFLAPCTFQLNTSRHIITSTPFATELVSVFQPASPMTWGVSCPSKLL